MIGKTKHSSPGGESLKGINSLKGKLFLFSLEFGDSRKRMSNSEFDGEVSKNVTMMKSLRIFQLCNNYFNSLKTSNCIGTDFLGTFIILGTEPKCRKDCIVFKFSVIRLVREFYFLVVQ